MAFLLAMHSTPLNPKVSSVPVATQIRANSRVAQDLVNQHLWIESKKQDLESEKANLANQNLAPQISESTSSSSRGKSTLGEVDHSADRFEANAFQDLNRYPKQYNFNNPDGIVQKQLFDAQAQSEAEEAARQDYANQFVENARIHGYEVKLGANYVVLSVKPISQAQQRRPSLFDNGIGSPAK